MSQLLCKTCGKPIEKFGGQWIHKRLPAESKRHPADAPRDEKGYVKWPD